MWTDFNNSFTFGFVDKLRGTLDVRLLRVSDSTIGVVRGAEEEWAGGPSSPPCGQLTRCFSAELLVLPSIELLTAIAGGHVDLQP